MITVRNWFHVRHGMSFLMSVWWSVLQLKSVAQMSPKLVNLAKNQVKVPAEPTAPWFLIVKD